MDYPLLFYTLASFLAASFVGQREYWRLARRWPDASLTNFHLKPGWVKYLLLFLVVWLVPALYLVLHRPSLWLLPEWLDLSQLWWNNGLVALLLGLLLGLASSACKREHLPNVRALAMCAVLGQAAILFMTAWMQRLVAAELSSVKWSGTMLRQTSGYSCAAASGANVASLFGLRYSEQEMARLMATRASGTSPAWIVRGLQRAGLAARKFEDTTANPETLPLPAILLVDHPATGPESHAVAALRYHPETKALEIWDPIEGPVLMTQNRLKKVWCGHGIACHGRP